MLYSIKTFGGMLPRVNPRLLQDQNAQVATGTKLRSGSLVPFNAPSILEQLDSPTDVYRTLYQYEHTAEDIFLTFENDVDIVKGPVANDQYNRTYITGLDKPRGFDTSLVASTDATIDETNSYELAIPVGDAALLATSGTGTGEITSRAYVYTYIRTWADTKFDEGAPSAPAENVGSSTEYIDVQTGETVTISYIEDAPDQADNGVNRIAVYRTAVGTSDATYQLVIDFNIDDAKAGTVSGVTWNAGTSTFSYDDDLTDGELGTSLPSATWTAPDDNLQGLISLRNGCLVGFVDNVIHFSEPYQLHAWPVEYQVIVDQNIIGLGAFGNTVVALTNKFPILLNAQDPSLIIAQPTQATAPCLSKRGIVNYENTVYFPSSDGLIAVSSEGIQNVTQTAFTADEWLDYYPSTFEAAIQDGRYFGFYQNSAANNTGFLIVDLEEALAAISTEVFGVSCFYADKRSDTLYFIQYDDAQGWQILQWEGLASFRTLTWKSKIFTSQIGPANLAACRVRAMYLTQAEIDAINAILEEQAELAKAGLKGAVNEVPFNVLTFNGDIYTAFDRSYVLVPKLDIRFYVDEALIHTEEDVSSMKPFRLPAGIVGDYFEIEVESNFPVYQIDFATSMRELQ
jgi:hypothetical protein